MTQGTKFVKIIGVVTVLAILMTIGVFFASPYWTVYQLKNAYENQDAHVINRHINFPSVQADIKTQLQPVLVTKLQGLTQSPLARLLNVQVDENVLVGKLVTQAVDNAITPDSVQAVLNAQGNAAAVSNHVKLLGGLTAVAMDKIKLNPETLADLITAPSTEALNEKLLSQITVADKKTADRSDAASNNAKSVASYCGINCFHVQTQLQGYPLTVEMARIGFAHWQIVAVKLPL